MALYHLRNKSMSMTIGATIASPHQRLPYAASNSCRIRAKVKDPLIERFLLHGEWNQQYFL
jgi:hypothetical protein